MSAGQAIADGLAEHGWHLCGAFAPAHVIEALAADIATRLARGELRAAGTGAGGRYGLRRDVRGDAIAWLEPDSSEPLHRDILARFEQLRTALNRELQLGLFGFECHYAAYPPGAVYRRHRDQLAGDARRAVSAVLYLNRDWARRDGGELRLYLPGEGGHVDVEPRAGALVTFLSARFEHEVLPALRPRLSLAGWFRRRAGAPLRDIP